MPVNQSRADVTVLSYTMLARKPPGEHAPEPTGRSAIPQYIVMMYGSLSEVGRDGVGNHGPAGVKGMGKHRRKGNGDETTNERTNEFLNARNEQAGTER